jgi:hypothetical protein
MTHKHRDIATGIIKKGNLARLAGKEVRDAEDTMAFQGDRVTVGTCSRRIMREERRTGMHLQQGTHEPRSMSHNEMSTFSEIQTNTNFTF